MLSYTTILLLNALACSSSASEGIGESGVVVRVPPLNPVQICKDKLETSKLIVTNMPRSQIKVDWSTIYWKCHNLTRIDSVIVQIRNLNTSTHLDKIISSMFNDAEKWILWNLENPCNEYEFVLKIIFTHKDGRNETKSQPTYVTAKDTEICHEGSDPLLPWHKLLIFLGNLVFFSTVFASYCLWHHWTSFVTCFQNIFLYHI